MDRRYGEDWRAVAKEVRRRDGWRCVECGATGVELHVHHIVPLSKGGRNDVDNLETLCRECHEAKHPHMARQRVEPSGVSAGSMKSPWGWWEHLAGRVPVLLFLGYLAISGLMGYESYEIGLGIFFGVIFVVLLIETVWGPPRTADEFAEMVKRWNKVQNFIEDVDRGMEKYRR